MLSRRRSIVRTRVEAAALALVVAAGGLTLAGVAGASPPSFNGTYTVVQKSFTIDPRTGARIDQPDQVSTWIVFSACTLPGCAAHVVSNSLRDFGMAFDGTRWNRVALPPQTGTCNGATVPATSAAEFLVPRSDGTLTGAATATVDCNGVPIDSTQPLVATPA